MGNFINIVDDQGKEVEVEVLDIFTVAGYDNKDYIMYTMNKEIDENNIEVLVSILKKEGNVYNLETITDEKEWEEVQKAINEMGDVE